MRGLNKIPFIVNRPWVQVFLTFGGSLLIVFLAVLLRDKVWDRVPAWSGIVVAAVILIGLFAEGSFEEWSQSERAATTLKERLIPVLRVMWDGTYRETTDKTGRWIILRVHNTSDTSARNVYVKLTAVNVIFAANAVPLVPAHGARLKWNHTSDQVLNIAPDSREDVQIGFANVTTPQSWFVAVADTSAPSPLPPGVYDVAIDVCSDNTKTRSLILRLSYKHDGHFDLSQPIRTAGDEFAVVKSSSSEIPA